MTEKDQYRIEDGKLDKVDGGGLFSGYSNDEYKKAGVKVIGAGIFVDSGYEYRGKKISTEDANKLVFFSQYQGRPAASLKEARDYFDKISGETDKKNQL